MTQKHTPGPWKLEHIGYHDGHRAVKAKNGVVICEMDGGQNDDGQVFKNAQLIAAAPELLEALVALVENRDGAMEKAIKTIEKAKGV